MVECSLNMNKYQFPMCKHQEDLLSLKISYLRAISILIYLTNHI